MSDLIAEYDDLSRRILKLAGNFSGVKVKPKNAPECVDAYNVVATNVVFGVRLTLIPVGIADSAYEIKALLDSVEIVDDSKDLDKVEIKANSPNDEDTRIIKKPASDLVIEPADDFERLQIAVTNVERLRDELADLSKKSLPEGTRVYHKEYGWGTVESSGLIAHVMFDGWPDSQVVCLYELSTARWPLDLNRGLVSFADDPQTPITPAEETANKLHARIVEQLEVDENGKLVPLDGIPF